MDAKMVGKWFLVETFKNSMEEGKFALKEEENQPNTHIAHCRCLLLVAVWKIMKRATNKCNDGMNE